MGVDIQHGGAASYFPEEPGLDQSGRQALAVPWGPASLATRASCPSLKETGRARGKACLLQGGRAWGRAPGAVACLPQPHSQLLPEG